MKEEKYDTIEIQRIRRVYCEQLHANYLDNLEEMDKFLESYSLLRLNHEEMENLDRLITSKENETVIKGIPKKQKSRTRELHR